MRRLLVLSSVWLVACDGGPAASEFRTPSPQVLRRGSQIFRERCSPCHGDTGHGDGVLADLLPIRPRNYHADPFKWGRTPAGIVETVAFGRSGVMPAFRGALDEADLWAVAQLVWAWMPPSQRAQDEPDTLARGSLP